MEALLTELRTAAATAMMPAPSKPTPKPPEPLSTENYWDQRKAAAEERRQWREVARPYDGR